MCCSVQSVWQRWVLERDVVYWKPVDIYDQHAVTNYKVEKLAERGTDLKAGRGLSTEYTALCPKRQQSLQNHSLNISKSCNLLSTSQIPNLRDCFRHNGFFVTSSAVSQHLWACSSPVIERNVGHQCSFSYLFKIKIKVDFTCSKESLISLKAYDHKIS